LGRKYDYSAEQKWQGKKMTNETQVTTRDVQEMDKHFLHPWEDVTAIGAEARTVVTHGDGIYVTDSDGNRMIDPPLTTVMVYKQRMGMIALKRLIERIDEAPAETIKIEVNTTIVERKSVIKRS